jgi:protein-S-isoprenylcysteine O-methyltransferase Ste14
MWPASSPASCQLLRRRLSLLILLVPCPPLWPLALYLGLRSSAEETIEGRRPDADHLVTDGPYRFVRHPLSLGAILCSLGSAILRSRCCRRRWLPLALRLISIRLAKSSTKSAPASP